MWKSPKTAAHQFMFITQTLRYVFFQSTQSLFSKNYNFELGVCKKTTDVASLNWHPARPHLSSEHVDCDIVAHRRSILAPGGIPDM